MGVSCDRIVVPGEVEFRGRGWGGGLPCQLCPAPQVHGEAGVSCSSTLTDGALLGDLAVVVERCTDDVRPESMDLSPPSLSYSLPHTDQPTERLDQGMINRH